MSNVETSYSLILAVKQAKRKGRSSKTPALGKTKLSY
jgi:hypothetical protein